MIWKLGATAAACWALAGGAQAALFDRGGGMVYDSTSNITWLKDLNYAKTSGYDADGLMDWAQAKSWADQLLYGGFSDWRLPELNPADTTCDRISFPVGFPPQHEGYGCTGGELSHFFVADLGNKPLESVLNPAGDAPEQVANLALFSNVQSANYWSGTAYAPRPTDGWFFSSNDGYQLWSFTDPLGAAEMFAVAVRSGDVAAVPEAPTLATFLAGLGGLAAVASGRRRRHGAPALSARCPGSACARRTR